MNLVDTKPQSFYVWQRAWIIPVKQAVQAEEGMLYPLTSEFDRQGLTTLRVDWNSFRSLAKVTAVIRVHINWLDEPGLVDKIVNEFKKYPAEILGLQLDLDCPTRRLGDYAKLLKNLKRRLSSRVKLSITVLPSHLKFSTFKRLLPFIDYYVLQVHGIEVPKRIDERVDLMNFSVAEIAFQRAVKLEFPFKLSLPTYAYRLFFDKVSGRFIRLSAENNPAGVDEFQQKIISADVDLLREFLVKLRPFSSDYQGIIWFRLPTGQDVLTVSRKLINRLATDKELNTGVKVFVKLNDTRQDLYVENACDFSLKRVKISLSGERRGDWELVRGFSTGEDDLPGQLPQKIFGELPTPGKAKFVGWFRPKENNKIKVSVECLGK